MKEDTKSATFELISIGDLHSCTSLLERVLKMVRKTHFDFKDPNKVLTSRTDRHIQFRIPSTGHSALHLHQYICARIISELSRSEQGRVRLVVPLSRTMLNRVDSWVYFGKLLE